MNSILKKAFHEKLLTVCSALRMENVEIEYDAKVKSTIFRFPAFLYQSNVYPIC